MTSFKGAFTALITPMTQSGDVDYEGFRRLIKSQLAGGIDGLVPLGTTGETPTLDATKGGEEDRLIQIVIQEVRSYEKQQGRKVSIILGAGSNNTKDAVEYVKRAKVAGADAALVVTPYYNKPSDEGIYKHFEAVSQVGIPIVVYNIQGRTGRNISTDLLLRIASLPMVVGVKEASGSVNQMMDVIAKVKELRPAFSVLSGDDALTLPLLALGGDGVVSVVSNLAPSRIVEMVHSALKGDFNTARTLHYKLLPFFRAAFVDGNPTSIKYALKLRDLDSGAVRLPLVEVNDNAKKIIKDALEECDL